MKAIVFQRPGPAEVLALEEIPPPLLEPDSIRIRVAATALNRADILQRRGLYPPPPGASEILGLECSGLVSEVGERVSNWGVGDRVMALLAGGGYAEEVVVPAGCVMPVPKCLSLEEAAGICETFLTVHLNLFEIGRLTTGQTVLVHGGGSGIGTAAIQLVKEVGAAVLVTAGSAAKCARCLALGADCAVNYREEDFAEAVRVWTNGRGVDVALDCVGGPYLRGNLSALAEGGSLVVIGLLGGAKAEISLAELLTRRLRVIGSTLRARPVSEKAALIEAFRNRFWGALEHGKLRPVIDRILPLERAAEAHRIMEAGEHFGKLVLRVLDDSASLPG